MFCVLSLELIEGPELFLANVLLISRNNYTTDGTTAGTKPDASDVGGHEVRGKKLLEDGTNDGRQSNVATVGNATDAFNTLGTALGWVRMTQLGKGCKTFVKNWIVFQTLATQDTLNSAASAIPLMTVADSVLVAEYHGEEKQSKGNEKFHCVMLWLLCVRRQVVRGVLR